ncbi:DUF2235 domain-containing protein, partial [Vibrio anguillarum]|nr:DUF2235 domain-containing protein [Vibrio anguillarum]
GSATNELTNVQKLFERYINKEFSNDKETYFLSEYMTGIGTGNSTNITPADESEIFGQGAGIGKYGVTAKVSTSVDQLSTSIMELKSTFANAQSNIVDGFNKLQFDVFGFSRGAAAARHFINVVLDGEQSEFAQTFSKACQKSGIPLAYGFDW